MIKFRCPVCRQKIAVNDEGAGVGIDCPTCTHAILVPPATDAEFLPPPPPPPPVPVVTLQREPAPATAHAQREIRSALVPHLARMMMDRVMQTLLLQRRQLLTTQRMATTQVVEMEQRLTRLQSQMQQRYSAYEARIAELNHLLAVKEEEKRQLIRERLQLTGAAMAAEEQRQRTHVHFQRSGMLVG